jgi:hypothetical protein
MPKTNRFLTPMGENGRLKIPLDSSQKVIANGGTRSDDTSADNLVGGLRTEDIQEETSIHAHPWDTANGD